MSIRKTTIASTGISLDSANAATITWSMYNSLFLEIIYGILGCVYVVHYTVSI